MTIPFEPVIFGLKVNIHLILEYLAFFVAYRYYVFLRKHTKDYISEDNRLTIILGAAIGSLIGSRLVGFLESPFIQNWNLETLITLMNIKTIMGGLFGGLLGVEGAKKIIGESQSSGDLFTLPIIVGIFIGRIGCFLSGVKEFTYGSPTQFFMGMDLGDGVVRHPTSLYELLFLGFLFVVLKRLLNQGRLEQGLVFQYFMIAYFAFRFGIEFIKPNTFFVFGLSSIQILCVICILYYRKTIYRLLVPTS